MKSIGILLIMLLCVNKTYSQELSINVDTISTSFLLENDFRLNSKDDVIIRSASLINIVCGDKLRQCYKDGIYLLGDSLSLGSYLDIVQNPGCDVMETQEFRNIMKGINYSTNKVYIQDYEFIEIKLTIVVGYLGKHRVPVAYSNIRIPVFYILEVL